MDEATEATPVWIAKTIGYVILAVIVTVILTNAVQSFFFERVIAGVSGGAGGAIGALTAGRRRRYLASSSKAEKNT